MTVALSGRAKLTLPHALRKGCAAACRYRSPCRAARRSSVQRPPHATVLQSRNQSCRRTQRPLHRCATASPMQHAHRTPAGRCMTTVHIVGRAAVRAVPTAAMLRTGRAQWASRSARTENGTLQCALRPHRVATASRHALRAPRRCFGSVARAHAACAAPRLDEGFARVVWYVAVSARVSCRVT